MSVLVAAVPRFDRECRGVTMTARGSSGSGRNAGHFVWLVSDDMLDEYRDVLRRRGVRRPTVSRVLNLLAESAELVTSGRLEGLTPPRRRALLRARRIRACPLQRIVRMKAVRRDTSLRKNGIPKRFWRSTGSSASRFVVDSSNAAARASVAMRL
jgi:hypothetical protein